MSFSTDETYVQTYQKYLKQKGSSEDLRKLTISQTAASTKVLKPALTDKDCKICRVLSKPGDLCRVLNQGLFHKYTSSQDYFYTRDINTLLSKKRKAFSVRYYDDLIFDECKERLKGYFKRKESVSLMSEIKQFYTKFKNFPRNFHTNFFHIINSNIRKHRRIEYMKVFNGANLDEDKQQDENDQADQKDNSKNGREAKEFHLMELLGDSFLKDNYKDISDVAIGGVKLDKPRDTARSIQEIEENFKALYKGSSNSSSDPNSGVFSNALYNKNYMLYSRSDSQTAEDILKQIVNEFKEADVGSKASMTLAEKVLHQVANAAATNSKKQENRYSPTLKQRAGGAFEFSPLIQGTRKPNNPIVATMQTQPITRQQSSLSNANNTSTRGQSNPRNNSRTEADNTNILGKVNQSKVYEQRKSTDKDKFPVEQLNDIVINRNKILSTLYQFRSTRSKSGGLKSVGASKTPSHKNAFPLGEPKSGDVYDSKYAQGQLIGNVNEKSEPVSPNRRASKEDSRPVGDMIVKVKPNLEISAYNTMKRSASQGLNGDFRELGSPMLSQISQSTQHKKASSVIKRRGTATPIKRGVNGASVQNYTLNNNSSINNMSNSHQETAVSPNHGKFINPLRASLGTTQQYYFRHQSPMDEKIQQISGVYQSEPTVNKINIRGMKHTSPNRTDNNYRANTLSLSGRQQNLLDLSQGVSSHGASQVLGQLNKTNPDPTKVKKIEKASMQAFAAKIIKRASLAPNQIITPVLELEEKEKRPRKVLELNESNYNTFKDLKLPSKEQTPVHIGVSSATTLNKFKVEVKKNTWSSYPLKAVSKDQNIRLTLKK